MARPKRNPATIQEIMESFSDMSTTDQEGLLATLTEIHRILKRERGRNFADPKDNAALLLDMAAPADHEQ